MYIFWSARFGQDFNEQRSKRQILTYMKIVSYPVNV